MKLTNIRPLGQYKHNDGRTCNIKKGSVVGRGTDVLFYLYRGNRVIVADYEFYTEKVWTKVNFNYSKTK